MTDAELKEKIVLAIKEHGPLPLRRLRQIVDPPGGQPVITATAQDMVNSGALYKKGRHGHIVFCLEKPRPAPKIKKPGVQKAPVFLEPEEGLKEIQLGPNHRRIVFGKNRPHSHGLRQRGDYNGIQSSMGMV